MRLDDPKSEHPKFQTYLEGFRKLEADKTIVNALAKFGKMPNDQAQKYLSGATPVLWVFKDIKRSEALTEFPSKLLVPLDLVAAYEADDKSAKMLTRKGRTVLRIGLHLLEAVISGHLLKFSPDDTDRNPAAWNKAAEGFEQEVYGGLK